mgnify:CR=1 FL=1
MAVEQLLRTEEDGSLSFGNHTLSEKAKLEDFRYNGDLMKVKTHKPMTKLERNGMFTYESVPGTSVYNFSEDEKGVKFSVEGNTDAQITLGLLEGTQYEVSAAGVSLGVMDTNMSGKLSFNVELGEKPLEVWVKRA